MRQAEFLSAAKKRIRQMNKVLGFSPSDKTIRVQAGARWRDVQRFIGGAVSFFSVYPGKDRSEPLARRHEIAGTLLEQARALSILLDAQVVHYEPRKRRS